MNPFVNIIKKEFWGRVLISAIIVLSFLAVLIGIEHAMLGNHQLDKDWKEVLMLLLGALIGGFSKVIDFWFKDHTNDKQLLDKIPAGGMSATGEAVTPTSSEFECQCEDCKEKRAAKKAQQNQTN